VSNEIPDLERDIEATRQQLASTIDELLYRTHPKTIAGREMAQVKGYYVDAASGEPRTDNILKTVGVVVGTVVLVLVVRKLAS